jgi:hypothetical protein
MEGASGSDEQYCQREEMGVAKKDAAHTHLWLPLQNERAHSQKKQRTLANGSLGVILRSENEILPTAHDQDLEIRIIILIVGNNGHMKFHTN